MTETPSMTPEDPTLASETPDQADEYEELRRRIYNLKVSGLSFKAVGAVVGLSAKNTKKHFDRARAEVVKDFKDGKWYDRAGESIKDYQWARQIARQHLAALEAGELDEHGQPKPGTSKKGSLQAAIWLQTFLRARKQEDDFCVMTGLFPKAADKLDITLKDARSMSLEELQQECARLEERLAGAKVLPDHAPELRKLQRTIDGTATVKLAGDEEKVAKSVERAAKTIADLAVDD
jgi:hypothetical protein